MSLPPPPSPSQPCIPGAPPNLALGQELETSFFFFLSGFFIARCNSEVLGWKFPPESHSRCLLPRPLSSPSADYPLPNLIKIWQF